jgi:hypothetical protein
MLDRARDYASFTVLFAIALGGAFRASFWIIAVGACLMALVLLASHGRSLAFARLTTPLMPDAIRIVASSLNATVVALVAYGIGTGAAWFWGV